MDSMVRIYCDEAFLAEDTSWTLDVLDLERLHVSMAGEARCNGDEIRGAEWKCIHCGEPLVEYPDEQWATVDGTQVRCLDSEDGHEPVAVPFAWLNSVALHLDEEADEVTFRASVGDPRGAFAFTLRRDPDTGRILIHVPYPGEPFPHRETRRLSDGTLEVI